MTPLLLLAQDTPPLRGWEAIVENNGIGVALTGMLIVFSALAIITMFIALVPHLLAVLEPILPKGGLHRESHTPAEQSPIDQERIVAAIGMVLHTELQKITKES